MAVTVFVLTRAYYDGSGFAVVRVYRSGAEAARDRDMLSEHAEGQKWIIHPVPLL